jgi:glycolate oxidase FAD binding subunit
VSLPLSQALAGLVGPAHCLTGADRGPFVVEGRTPAAVVFPSSLDEAGRVVAACAEAGVPVIPWGGGTAMHLGTPPREGAVVVVTRRLGRVVEHEPGDLTATVEAGITMEALQQALGARGQWVSLDPPLPARSTVGGVLATNAAGPRRYLYGTARDLVIGMRVVGADGAVVRSGGKVVKNVAGYDLQKLYIGSLGTLGLIGEVTFKLRPRPDAEGGCWAGFGTLAAAGQAVRAIMTSDLVPHSIELLDGPAAAACAAQTGVSAGGGAALLLGFDGLASTVAWQLREAERLLAAAGGRTVTALDEQRAGVAQAFVRDVRATGPEPLAAVRVAVLPTQVVPYLTTAAAVVAEAGLALSSVAHAGSGILRLQVTAPAGGLAEATRAVKVLAALRDQARGVGGELLVEWAPLAVKEEVAVWEPPGAAGRLQERIKAQLDPRGIMNPGRFVGGI